MDSLSPLQVILQVNSFGKGYGHGTPSTQENRQVIFKGNSFEKGYGHGTPSTQEMNKFFNREILLKRLRTRDTYGATKNKLILREIL